MARIVDLTLPMVDGMTVWPGDPAMRVSPHLTLEDDGVRVSALSLGTHTGTHIDAPFHLLPDGADVTSIPIEALCGAAQVVDLADTAVISAQALQAAATTLDCARILLRTSNSVRRILRTPVFARDYVALDASGAQWLVDCGVQLVGIDAMSVDVFESETLPAHRALLEAGVIILEGLDMLDAAPGRHELVCAPLRLVGADGAPARAWLVSDV